MIFRLQCLTETLEMTRLFHLIIQIHEPHPGNCTDCPYSTLFASGTRPSVGYEEHRRGQGQHLHKHACSKTVGNTKRARRASSVLTGGKDSTLRVHGREERDLSTWAKQRVEGEVVERDTGVAGWDGGGSMRCAYTACSVEIRPCCRRRLLTAT